MTLELNESPDRSQSESLHELLTSTEAVGVPQEYLPFTGGRRVTLTDARLVSIVKRWTELAETVRDRVDAFCRNADQKPATA